MYLDGIGGFQSSSLPVVTFCRPGAVSSLRGGRPLVSGMFNGTVGNNALSDPSSVPQYGQNLAVVATSALHEQITMGILRSDQVGLVSSRENKMVLDRDSISLRSSYCLRWSSANVGANNGLIFLAV